MAPVLTAGAVTTDGPNYDTYGYRTRVGRRTADATPHPPPDDEPHRARYQHNRHKRSNKVNRHNTKR